MSDRIERHRRACAGFTRVAGRVADDQWDRPTPCTDWDARALVEHVIGFHDFLLLRPLGVRAQRPRVDPAARWNATATALFTALGEPGALDRSTELPGGGTSTPGAMLGALTSDVLVHTWDLARAADIPPELDDALCREALAALQGRDLPRDDGMFAPAVRAADDADPATRLIAGYGRNPAWHAD